MKNSLLSNITKSTATAIICLSLFTQVHASPLNEELLGIQKQWADSVYTVKDKKAKYTKLQELVLRTNKLALQNPQSAELITWNGIVLSTFAGVKGGMGGLSLAKEARKKLEAAKKINPDILNGSIYVSLATLYSKVPSWPVGFGNKKKAKSNFIKALKINPKGIDANYFYAEFLADQNQKEQAISHLKNALNAPLRPNRPLADSGRKKEALQLLATLQ